MTKSLLKTPALLAGLFALALTLGWPQTASASLWYELEGEGSAVDFVGGGFDFLVSGHIHFPCANSVDCADVFPDVLVQLQPIPVGDPFFHDTGSLFFDGSATWFVNDEEWVLEDLDLFMAVGFEGIAVTEITLSIINGVGTMSGFNFVGSLETLSFSSTLIATPVHEDVPEPASLALFGFGLLGLGAMRRRRRAG